MMDFLFFIVDIIWSVMLVWSLWSGIYVEIGKNFTFKISGLKNIFKNKKQT